jgi:hypothetical protein
LACSLEHLVRRGVVAFGAGSRHVASENAECFHAR